MISSKEISQWDFQLQDVIIFNENIKEETLKEYF